MKAYAIEDIERMETRIAALEAVAKAARFLTNTTTLVDGRIEARPEAMGGLHTALKALDALDKEGK